MKTISNPISGSIRLTENSTYHSVHLSSVVVEENITARLYGSVEGKIHLKKGACLYLHGKFDGQLLNAGGVMHVFNPGGKIEIFARVCASPPDGTDES